MDSAAFAFYILKIAFVGLYLCFILGQVSYVLKRAGMAIRSKTNPLSSRWQYVEKYWDILLFRAGIEFCFFWLWVAYPAALTTIASKLHVTVNLTFPLVPPVAFLLGLGADWALDWLVEWGSTKLPRLKKDIPDVPDDQNAQAKDQAAGGGD